MKLSALNSLLGPTLSIGLMKRWAILPEMVPPFQCRLPCLCNIAPITLGSAMHSLSPFFPLLDWQFLLQGSSARPGSGGTWHSGTAGTHQRRPALSNVTFESESGGAAHSSLAAIMAQVSAMVAA